VQATLPSQPRTGVHVMGLFDRLVGIAAQALSQGQLNGLAEQLVNTLSDPRTGGIQGLVQRFQQQGLGEVISSWVGTGQNQPITAEQITNAIGSDRLEALARQLGVPPEQVSTTLTQLLPMLIDKLTPDGKIPSSSELLQAGLNLLKSRS